MTLPYDVARCFGTDVPLCRSCRRTEPGRDVWQVYTLARIDRIARACPNYIDTDAKLSDNSTTTKGETT